MFRINFKHDLKSRFIRNIYIHELKSHYIFTPTKIRYIGVILHKNKDLYHSKYTYSNIYLDTIEQQFVSTLKQHELKIRDNLKSEDII